MAESKIHIIQEPGQITALHLTGEAAPDADPLTLLNDPDPDTARHYVIVAQARRFYRSQGADFSGWVVEQDNEYSDSIPNRHEALGQLRALVRDYRNAPSPVSAPPRAEPLSPHPDHTTERAQTLRAQIHSALFSAHLYLQETERASRQADTPTLVSSAPLAAQYASRAVDLVVAYSAQDRAQVGPRVQQTLVELVAEQRPSLAVLDDLTRP